MTIPSPHLIICGYGWLGRYVARKFNTTAVLAGTTRDEAKASDMRARGMTALRFTLGDDVAPLTQLADGATLLLNIPAGRRHNDLTEYQAHMCDLVKAFAQTSLGHLIFISTTSVYGDQTDDPVTEHSPLAPDTASAHANAGIEACIKTMLPERYSILRLAGLTGPDRHPVHMLAGRTLDKGNKRINLVHISDVVNAIDVLVNRGPANRVLHLCSELHPKRGEYYTSCAKKLHLPAPTFSDTSEPPCGKTVDAADTLNYLGLSLVMPDPDGMC